MSSAALPEVLVTTTRFHGCPALIGQPDEIVPGARVTVLSPSGARQHRVVGRIAATLRDGRVVAWPADQVRWVKIDDRWALRGPGLVPGAQVEVTSGSGTKIVAVGSILDDSNPDDIVAFPAEQATIQPGVLYVRADGVVVRRVASENGRMRDEYLNARSGRWERAALAFNAPYKLLTGDEAAVWAAQRRRCPRCRKPVADLPGHSTCFARLPKGPSGFISDRQRRS